MTIPVKCISPCFLFSWFTQNTNISRSTVQISCVWDVSFVVQHCVKPWMCVRLQQLMNNQVTVDLYCMAIYQPYIFIPNCTLSTNQKRISFFTWFSHAKSAILVNSSTTYSLDTCSNSIVNKSNHERKQQKKVVSAALQWIDNTNRYCFNFKVW